MRDELRAYIGETFLFGEGQVTDDQQLFETGVIDSLGFMKLLAFVEQRFGVALDMSEVSLDNFASLDAMVATIERKRRARGGAAGPGRA